MKRSFAAAYIAAVFLVAPHLGMQASASEGLATDDLAAGISATELVESILGPGATASNVTFSGDLFQGGVFSGGGDIIGIEQGIVLSSGSVSTVVGPNQENGKTGVAASGPGDPDVQAIVGWDTYDAAVLEFDFELTSAEPTADISFQYVWSSEEYNESVYTEINDAMGLFLDGDNCATVGDPAVGVSVNTINHGNAAIDPTPTNGELFRDNDLDTGGGSINTEMDGLSVVLTCEATLTTGEPHHAKLAIADAYDDIYDSAVFVAGLPLENLRPTVLTAHPVVVQALPSPTTSLPQLSATLTDGDGTPMAGKVVTFTAGATTLCSDATDATGRAVCGGAQQTAQAAANGGFEATFAGSLAFASSSDHGHVLKAGDVIV